MPIYIGDYLSDTSELTAEEHGAYLLLLMHYWQKQGVIGSDIERLSRVCKTDVKTCSFILGYYFSLEDGNYKNKRADEEIGNAESRRLASSENGKKGGRPPKNNLEKTRSFSVGNLEKSSSPSPSSLQELNTTCTSYSTDTPKAPPEEARDPIPEPVIDQPEPGEYPKMVYAAWAELGAHVYQPSSLWAFASKWSLQVAPYIKGIHSGYVLAAIGNLKAIYEAPPGTYYWTQKVGVEAFFSKHLEKFLPANFDPGDFKVRAASWEEKQEAGNRAAILAVFGEDAI